MQTALRRSFPCAGHPLCRDLPGVLPPCETSVGVLVQSRACAHLHIVSIKFLFIIFFEPHIQTRRNIMDTFMNSECVSVDSHDQGTLATRELHILQAFDLAIVPPLCPLLAWTPKGYTPTRMSIVRLTVRVNALKYCLCQVGLVQIQLNKSRPLSAMASNLLLQPSRGHLVTDGRRMHQV